MAKQELGQCITQSPKHVRNIMIRAFQANRPLFIWGPPGIGKSDLVHDIARSGKRGDGGLGKTKSIDLRLALMEPTDLRGFPMIAPGTQEMIWAAPSELPNAAMAEEYDTIILFLDEMNSAPPSVQAAAYQLVLDRKIGAYCLPDNVRIVAAGNRDTDRGVTFRMPAPLANRFRHVNMEVKFEDWQGWAIQHNIHPDVIGYLTHMKGDLFDFNPAAASQGFATPRSWTYVSEILNVPGFATADKSEQRAEVAGAIGDGFAIKFLQHREYANKMPNPEDVLSGKVTTLNEEMKNHISAKYSLVIQLSYELNRHFLAATEANGGNKKFTPELSKQLNYMLEFAFSQLQPEMVILLLRTVLLTYGITFNFRTDLSVENRKVFADKYMSLVID